MLHKLASALLLRFRLGCLAGVVALEATSAPGATTSEATGKAPAQAALEAEVAKAGAGGAVAAIITPAGTEFFVAGSLSKDRPEPPTPDTVFEVGSITKGFTGLLLADMELAGEVAATDTLARRLTDWPAREKAAAGQVTLLQLATHHSGLPPLPGNMDEAWFAAHGANPYAAYDAKLLYAWLDVAKPELGADGKAGHLYSNVGFGTLGHTLAVVAGQPYEKLLRDRVLVPLGLKDTAITLDAAAEARRAPGHAGGEAAGPWDFDVLAGAGAVKSTARDLARFARFALVPAENPLRAALARATTDFDAGPAGMRIGYGWMLVPTPTGPLVWHNGETGGYHTQIGWSEKVGVAVVVLASNNRFDHDAAFAALFTEGVLRRQKENAGAAAKK